MSYKQLDVGSVVEYLQNIDEVKSFFGTDDLQAKEIGDGNLNFVYLVSAKNDASKSLIVKQAVPYLRCVGEEYALGKERMTYEIRALKQFKAIAPEFVPEIYHASEEMSLVVMQYLGSHKILRYGLMEKMLYPRFAQHIASYLAQTLFKTSSLYLQSNEKRALIDQFNANTELCKLTEDFVFTTAFMDHETNDNENVKNNSEAKVLFADMEFKKRVLDLKYKFMTQTDALIHGDLHTGSIMANEDETYVIDPEFAFVGPFGFDVGALIANLVNNYIHHEVVTNDVQYQNYLLQTIKEIYILFEKEFLQLWKAQKESALIADGFLDNVRLQQFQKEFVHVIFGQSIGFAGCKMARRVFGVAGVSEIRGIEDKQLRARAEKMALKIARKFVMQYDQIQDVDALIALIQNH